MEGTSSFALLELFQLGGIFMWPLLAFSVATVAIALERIIYLGRHNLRIDDLKLETEKYIRSGRFAEAGEFLEKQTDKRMGARVLFALVSNADLPEYELAEKAAEAEAGECIASLENGFNYLTALGSLSPLTGFLGTVSGMIGAFRSIAEAEDVSAQIVANGIYEALITTVFGLCIAIVAMIAHSLFSGAVDKFAGNIEKACSDLIIDIAKFRHYGKTEESPAPQSEPVPVDEQNEN
ncbi:MotA/TolQ/ExbB proton channel family protein [Brucepastera parasyntrophica]|uniref:MotA/TolQ/ExbB proton channel family protein n=1 Tax=Brucepastera parasyntrophica TaxID=2880008 RepID=UPI002108BCCE|nr:MotA/TolQ/ExbB proton channel family protein [Brucepastera parasyntrophica]ULQ58866.1 MotA/TolQ/ExbB proton channel family protein [Brucepastera parasyntrophica]